LNLSAILIKNGLKLKFYISNNAGMSSKKFNLTHSSLIIIGCFIEGLFSYLEDFKSGAISSQLFLQNVNKQLTSKLRLKISKK